MKESALRQLTATTLECVPENPVNEANVLSIFQASECRNHRGETHRRLLEVLNWIIVELPGSHGVVYYYDDEDTESAARDGYCVITVARGVLTVRRDPTLLPDAPDGPR